ncbi:MAG: TetR family transcriptional regulator [Polyangiaceae bacterium]
MAATAEISGESAEGGEVRTRILASARREFAQHGFGAASVRTLAQRAGVTAAMVNYYFGGKRGLYRSVVSEAQGRLLERLAAAVAADPPRAAMGADDGVSTRAAMGADDGVSTRAAVGADDGVTTRAVVAADDVVTPRLHHDDTRSGVNTHQGDARGGVTARLAGAYFDFLVEERELQRLLLRRMLDESDEARASAEELVGALRGLLEQYFPAREVAAQYAVSVFGAISGYFIYEPVLGAFLGADPLDPERLAARRRHVVELASMIERTTP